MAKLLLATGNRGKVREFEALLRGVPFELVTPGQVHISTLVEESGKTYADNACLKATALSSESGLMTLADDSGIEVDALGGEPGIHSARFGGKGLSDSDRVNLLLLKLKNVPLEKRTARFVSVIAIAVPNGDVYYARGVCEGIIALEPKGAQGFGYDPVFYFPELGKTMAELDLETKNRVSHRGKAAVEAREILIGLAKNQNS